jgi:hypothetical protein
MEDYCCACGGPAGGKPSVGRRSGRITAYADRTGPVPPGLFSEWRHPCKSKSREKHKASGRAPEGAHLNRSGCS